MDPGEHGMRGDGERTRLRRLLGHLYRVWLCQLVDVGRARRLLTRYGAYLRDWRRYGRLPGAETLRFEDSYPCLEDQTETTGVDPHYFYQALWAIERIVRRPPSQHVDVGSDVRFVSWLTIHTRVTFVDIRPLRATVRGLTPISGSLLALPFRSGGVESLSCLHVVEHVGLGRYGDPLDPGGTRLACRELARVLAPGGHLFLSAPVGRPRVCFNAHRIYSPEALPSYLPGLELIEFSVVDDAGELRVGVSPAEASDARWACGLYWMRKKGDASSTEGSGAGGLPVAGRTR